MADVPTYDFAFREDYLNERLTVAERAAYEDAMLADPELERDLMRHIALRNWLEADLAATVTPVRVVTLSSSWRDQLSTYRYLISAAVILLLMIPLWIWLRPDSPTADAVDLDQTYATYYQTMPDVTGTLPTRTMGPEEPDSDSGPKALAFQAYRDRNWKLAQERLAAYRQDTLDGDALFYLAMTHLELAQYPAAATQLRAYLQTQDTYALDARWYLALANLKLGNPAAAHEQLIPLSQKPNPFRARALEVLSLLPK